MTLSDYRRAVDQGKSVAYFSQVASASEYYPFGMLLTEGNYSSGSYRFGFQGQEMDNEIKGTGNSINFKYRMHDPRIGRFFAVDPLASDYPYWTPYQFAGLMPILARELEGLEPIIEVFHLTQPEFLNDMEQSEYQKRMTAGTIKATKYTTNTMAIVGGVVAVVASAGTAAPAVVTALGVMTGSMSVASGTAKMVVDIVDDINSTEKTRTAQKVIPSSPVSFIAVALDIILEDDNFTIKGTVELVEGMYKFKPTKNTLTVLESANKTVDDVNTLLNSVEYSEMLSETVNALEENEHEAAESQDPSHSDDSSGSPPSSGEEAKPMDKYCKNQY